MTDICMVPLGRLLPARDNPRKTAASAADDEALAASIRAHGLLQPLLVQQAEDGFYEVVEGNRRLKALQGFSADVEIPVLLRDANGTFEAATAANMMRSAMHPLDECEAISRLIGEDVEANLEAVAQRFGQTLTWARQRLKLADLAPKVKDAFREGRMGLQAAMAFTIGSWSEQEKLLKGLTLDDDEIIRPDWIRHNLTYKRIRADQAAFDLALYPQDQIERDLFSEDVWLLDRDKFEELQKAEFDKTVEALKKEGWGEVLAFESRDKYAEAVRRYVRVEGRIKKADRVKLTAMVAWNYQKTAFEISKGLASRKQARAIRKAATTDGDTVEADKVEIRMPYDLTKDQAQMLCEMMQVALQEQCARYDTVALWTFIAAPLGRLAAWSHVRPGRSYTLPEGEDFTKLAEVEVPKSLAEFEELTPKERMMLVRRAAVLMVDPHPPEPVLREWDLEGWFRPVPAFIEGWKLDQLKAYGQMVGLPAPGKDAKKKAIVEALMSYMDDNPESIIPPLEQFMGGTPIPDEADDPDDEDEDEADDDDDTPDAETSEPSAPPPEQPDAGEVPAKEVQAGLAPAPGLGDAADEEARRRQEMVGGA